MSARRIQPPVNWLPQWVGGRPTAGFSPDGTALTRQQSVDETVTRPSACIPRGGSRSPRRVSPPVLPDPVSPAIDGKRHPPVPEAQVPTIRIFAGIAALRGHITQTVKLGHQRRLIPNHLLDSDGLSPRYGQTVLTPRPGTLSVTHSPSTSNMDEDEGPVNIGIYAPPTVGSCILQAYNFEAEFHLRTRLL